MKAKVATSVVRDVAGTGSNSGASEGKKGRASPALREAAASGGTGGARTQEMTVGGADDADDEGQSVGRHEGMEAATIIVASLETMAAALQDLMAIVVSIQAGGGRRTEPEGARRRRQRAAGGGGPSCLSSSNSEVSSDSDRRRRRKTRTVRRRRE
ncbi:hypothetical protein PF005_g18668 [Phytophthora fragariae]|uniref:Uncharacterized protein n=1 Tax=Phytophthora fragariae TaxID=53985 RepID=A0A6A3R8X0_9STRA|nr:hypothetical protein PF009_g17010 [Phytophthora fragariae]KAE8992816.1 hypothetical protein PF011_g17400 [Phytophthora fragariae]KAE9082918.1 hypothetical protein PF010_g21399 [Phytophthora fragariae]KAE9091662.1 hypothetical protein PF007_g18788 [Phytophthora fragariae]KAE9122687.1 hypothetical protein PF006_g17595 [Phytophthora fragariae]